MFAHRNAIASSHQPVVTHSSISDTTVDHLSQNYKTFDDNEPSQHGDANLKIFHQVQQHNTIAKLPAQACAGFF
jgi:hypothetical protein